MTIYGNHENSDWDFKACSLCNIDWIEYDIEWKWDIKQVVNSIVLVGMF